MNKKYFIVKTEADRSIAQLIKDGLFKEWHQTPKKYMSAGDVVFIYDINLTVEAKNKEWLPFKCAAELADVDIDKETMDLRLLYKIDFIKLKFDKDEKETIKKMQQGSDGVYKLENQEIIFKLEKQCEDNIVKRVCKELNITQRELAERIGMSEGGLRSALSLGKITPQVEKACEMVLKIYELEKELENYKILQNALKSMIV